MEQKAHDPKTLQEAIECFFSNEQTCIDTVADPSAGPMARNARLAVVVSITVLPLRSAGSAKSAGSSSAVKVGTIFEDVRSRSASGSSPCG